MAEKIDQTDSFAKQALEALTTEDPAAALSRILQGRIPSQDSISIRALVQGIKSRNISPQTIVDTYNHFVVTILGFLAEGRRGQVIHETYNPNDLLLKDLESIFLEDLFPDIMLATMETKAKVHAELAKSDPKKDSLEKHIAEIKSAKAMVKLMEQKDLSIKLLLKWLFEGACADAEVFFLKRLTAEAVEREAILERHPDIVPYHP